MKEVTAWWEKGAGMSLFSCLSSKGLTENKGMCNTEKSSVLEKSEKAKAKGKQCWNFTIEVD